jgi:hypothetical protein
MAFRQCWAITSEGRCPNNALKDKQFCRKHRDRTITVWKKISFYLKKYRKRIKVITSVVITLLTLIFAFVEMLLPLFEFANPKLLLSLDPKDNYPNSVFVKLENKSKIFSIKDIEVIPEIFYSSYKGPIVISNVQRDIKSIKEIRPEKLDTINFNVIGIVRDQGVQEGAVCFCVKYKGGVGFTDREKEDSLGMYFDTRIKTTEWKETSCKRLRTEYRSPYACI